MDKVLIVDDDQLINDICEEVLEKANYNVFIAKNGKLATKILNEEKDIAVVITDIIMPEKDGIQFIKELRKNYPGIKIIAMSGGGKINANQYLDMASKLGADMILEKPFDIDHLTESVDKVLDK